MSIKTGSKTISIPPHSAVRFLAETRATLINVTADGELGGLLATTANGVCRVRTGDQVAQVLVKVPDGEHWSYDTQDLRPFDPSDPVPHETAEDSLEHETLEQKLKRFAGELIMERFGAQSQEVETFEESLDFDIDGDGEVARSGFEVMEDEYPLPGGVTGDSGGEPPTEPVESRNDSEPVSSSDKGSPEGSASGGVAANNPSPSAPAAPGTDAG